MTIMVADVMTAARDMAAELEVSVRRVIACSDFSTYVDIDGDDLHWIVGERAGREVKRRTTGSIDELMHCSPSTSPSTWLGSGGWSSGAASPSVRSPALTDWPSRSNSCGASTAPGPCRLRRGTLTHTHPRPADGIKCRGGCRRAGVTEEAIGVLDKNEGLWRKI
ncbi:hypothetical protein ABZY03_02365 [Streptomyces klenkii]|uniref:hypothetical protein n=1 Tax=Streptomyces klenkii TaxID=1420899 RepID=UPI0033ACE607